MPGFLGEGNSNPINTASVAQQCSEFITQRSERAITQGHLAKRASNSSLEKYKGEKECSINSARHVTLGSQPCRAESLWAELTSFPRLPKAKEAQTEKYHLLSSIGLMINETFLRTMNEQKQCPSVLHGHMTDYSYYSNWALELL